MELQLQIFLIIGIVALLLALLIVAVSVMAYFLIKLHYEVARGTKESAYQRKHGAAFNNPSMEADKDDDELSRRYTMHTLERGDPMGFANQNYTVNETTTTTTKTHNAAKNAHGGSAIDVSEQFVMKRQNGSENSRYNSSIIMHVEDRRGTKTSVHELRTPFNDEAF